MRAVRAVLPSRLPVSVSWGDRGKSDLYDLRTGTAVSMCRVSHRSQGFGRCRFSVRLPFCRTRPTADRSPLTTARLEIEKLPLPCLSGLSLSTPYLATLPNRAGGFTKGSSGNALFINTTCQRLPAVQSIRFTQA